MFKTQKEFFQTERTAVPKVQRQTRFKTNEFDKKTYVEVQIPVAWGQISGKWWGSTTKRPILAIHNLFENAGSFDRLIPLITDRVGVLAVDLVGHGRSDKLPKGAMYNELQIIYIIETIKEYFEWEFVSLLGHSNGAVCVMLYCALYPHRVDFAIFLDGFYPNLPSKAIKARLTAENITSQVQMTKEHDQEPYSTSLSVLGKNVQIQSGNSIDIHYVDNLLERGVIPSAKSPGSYYPSVDPRVAFFTYTYFDEADCLRAIQNFKFGFLLIKTKDSPLLNDTSIFGRFYNAASTMCRSCEFREIDGTHHVHLNEPDKIAATINEFIQNHDRFDRSGGIKNVD